MKSWGKLRMVPTVDWRGIRQILKKQTTVLLDASITPVYSLDKEASCGLSFQREFDGPCGGGPFLKQTRYQSSVTESWRTGFKTNLDEKDKRL